MQLGPRRRRRTAARRPRGRQESRQHNILREGDATPTTPTVTGPAVSRWPRWRRRAAWRWRRSGPRRREAAGRTGCRVRASWRYRPATRGRPAIPPDCRGST
ncbi:hypothetical protein DV26_01915 [Amycolatopsis mediterranei]|nr:hypothetical protein DV26_01915 [Amycolatopsis mediterranei]KDU88504.1 hypothetical protein DV36_29705 [Amycolatopsis mediterranei]